MILKKCTTNFLGFFILSMAVNIKQERQRVTRLLIRIEPVWYIIMQQILFSQSILKLENCHLIAMHGHWKNLFQILINLLSQSII